jgi:hypothetical protein
MRLVELLGRYSKIPPPLNLPPNRRQKRPRTPPGLIHSVRKRLGPEIVQQLVNDYEAGKSTTALTTSYGLGKGTVLAILDEQGVRMRGQGLVDDTLPEATELYLAGWSLKRVGAHLDCTAETVRQALMAAGVSLRAPWERGPRSI